jgi:hypothetical protein
MREKLLALLVIWLVGIAARAENATGQDSGDALANKVREELLDQRSPVTVNVSMHGITTLQFPAHIDAVDGDGFATKPSQDAQFLIVAGDNWLSLKSLQVTAEQNLNVIIHGRVYPILIRTRQEHDFAVLFKEPSTGPLPKTSLAEVKRQVSRKRISTARIIGLLDKLKGYPTFSQQAPAIYLGMDLAEPEKQGKGAAENDQIKTQIVRVLRDNQMDAVGFELLIENKTDVPYRYDPGNFAVRVGEEVYTNTLGDGQGLIPAHTKQTAYFIVAASAESNVPNDLAVYNDFKAIVRPIQ